MGQVALGFRSLLIKAAIFFFMALLLAWALGGTLWPRAQKHALQSVQHDHATWFWQISIGGLPEQHLRWQLMTERPGENAKPVDDRIWNDVADVLEKDGVLYYGGRLLDGSANAWRIETRTENKAPKVFLLPDRLALEQQMARVRSGLSLQSPTDIEQQRPIVLDPAFRTADSP